MKLFVDSAARETTLNFGGQTASQEKYNYIFHEDTTNVRCLKLLSLLVPRSFYAVVAGWSQRFEWTEGASTARSVNLPEGTYDGATLATTLSGLVSAVTGGFTVTYDEATNKLTFVNASGGDITLGTNITGLTTTFPDPGVNTILGLSGQLTLAITTGNSFTAPNMVNMSVPSYLFVTISSGSVNNSRAIRDWYMRRQFMVSFGDTPYLGYKEQPVNSQFCQGERIDNQVFRNILVKWRTGIANVVVTNSSAATQEKEYPLSFNGVDHQMIFEAT